MSSSLVTSHLIRHASPGPLSFISFSSFSPSATTKHNTEIKLIVTKNKDTIFCNIIEIAWERGNSRKRYLSSDANVSSFLLAESPPRDLQLNNYLKIMVCSCVMLFNCFWLQILFCSCIIETALFSFLRSLLCKNGRSLRFPKIFLKKQTRWMIKQLLLNSVITKYRDLSVSRRSIIICLSLWLQQIIDLLVTDKYFAQPRPIITKYLHICATHQGHLLSRLT